MGARLNILPQKRWNVYGRENRLKVKRDEEQAAAEQAEKDAVHQKAESEYRHVMLLKRARARSGAEDTSTDVPSLTLDTEALEASEVLRQGGADAKEAEAAAKASAVTNSQPSKAPNPSGAADFDLLGFLRAEPSKDAHPEVAEERRQEARKRGEAKTQTSDARFDAQFAFGHGLTGAANQPWYATGHLTLGSDEDEEASGRADRGASGQRPALTGVPSSSSESVGARSRQRRHKEGNEKKRHKSGNKKSDKKAKKKKRRRRTPSPSAEVRKADLLAAMRKEAAEREAVERVKARRAIKEATCGIDGEPEGKRYHASYGSRHRH